MRLVWEQQQDWVPCGHPGCQRRARYVVGIAEERSLPATHDCCGCHSGGSRAGS